MIENSPYVEILFPSNSAPGDIFHFIADGQLLAEGEVPPDPDTRYYVNVDTGEVIKPGHPLYDELDARH